MHQRTALTTPVALVLLALAASAATYVVEPDGSGDFEMIQFAVNAASNGDTVLLGDGIFNGEWNSSIDFLGKAIVVRSQSGSPEECIVDCYAYESPWWRRGFLFQSGEGRDSVLDGVTIRRATWYQNATAGGIYCTSSPTVSNCIIEDCVGRGYGGGILCAGDGCAPLLIDCLICGNTAEEAQGIGAKGGGISCIAGAAPLLVRCRIVGNGSEMTEFSLGAYGGGIHCGSGASPVFRLCEIIGNHSDGIGGGIMSYYSDPLFEDCTIAANTAGYEGAWAMRIGTAGTFRGCTIVAHGGSGPSIDVGEDSWVQFFNTLVGFNEAAFGELSPSEDVTLTCCDIFGNVEGDWVGRLADQLGEQGNIHEDPRFCDYAMGDYSLQEDSPCAPHSEPNPSCSLIGALGVACPGSTPAEDASWGKVKAMYRLAPSN